MERVTTAVADQALPYCEKEPGASQQDAGDRTGQHSVRINQQWRICFRWQDSDAYDIEIVDYH